MCDEASTAFFFLVKLEMYAIQCSTSTFSLDCYREVMLQHQEKILFAILSFWFPMHCPCRNFSKPLPSFLFSNNGKLYTQNRMPNMSQWKATEWSEERHVISYLLFFRVVDVLITLKRNKTPFTLWGLRLIPWPLHIKILKWFSIGIIGIWHNSPRYYDVGWAFCWRRRRRKRRSRRK